MQCVLFYFREPLSRRRVCNCKLLLLIRELGLLNSEATVELVEAMAAYALRPSTAKTRKLILSGPQPCHCTSAVQYTVDVSPMIIAATIIYDFFDNARPGTDRRRPSHILRRGTTAARAAEFLLLWLSESDGIAVLPIVCAFLEHWSAFRRLFFKPGSRFLRLAVDHLEAALASATTTGQFHEPVFISSVCTVLDMFIPVIMCQKLKGPVLLDAESTRLRFMAPILLTVMQGCNLNLVRARAYLRMEIGSVQGFGAEIERTLALLRFIRLCKKQCRCQECPQTPRDVAGACTGCSVFRYCRREVRVQVDYKRSG